MIKQEQKIGKLVGRKGNEFYYCDYIFEHGTFKGVVGSVMTPIGSEEAKDRRENWDEDGELWRQAVQEGATELGINAWHKMVLDTAGDDVVFDLSYADTYGNDLLEFLNNVEFELVECIGGGRCFYTDMKWDELYDKELWEHIKQAETPKQKTT